MTPSHVRHSGKSHVRWSVLVFSQNRVVRDYLVAVTGSTWRLLEGKFNFYEDPIKCHVVLVIATEILQLPRVIATSLFSSRKSPSVAPTEQLYVTVWLHHYTLECDQLRVSILSVRDTDEKVIWREFTTMKTIPNCRNWILQKVPRCKNSRTEPFFGRGVVKYCTFCQNARPWREHFRISHENQSLVWNSRCLAEKPIYVTNISVVEVLGESKLSS